MDDAAKHTPRALALLTPAYYAPEAVVPETMPVALVIAECDGNVGTKQPLIVTKQLPPLRPAPTLVYTLPRGTHNAFSTKLDIEKGLACRGKDFLAPGKQRAIASALLPDFFDLALALPDA
jgi:hypothetical protein